MDTITHALSGMLLARATRSSSASGEPQKQRLDLRSRIIAGAVAAAFPDIDIIVRFFGTLNYLNYHRGITHSILMMPLWALLLAWLFSLLSRKGYRWQAFYPVCLMGIGIHILGDVITAYGTMVLAPFSDWRMSWPTTFIIDVFFTGIIVISLLLAWWWKDKSTQISRAGMGVLVAYVLTQGGFHYQAQEMARDYVRAHKLPDARIHALPQPLSPFNWKLVVESDDRYFISYVNLRRHTVVTARASDNIFRRVDALYRPRDKQDWQQAFRFGEPASEYAQVARLWHNPLLDDIRHFMMLPMLVKLEDNGAGRCAWFMDQRFSLQGVRAPFQFGVCREGGQDWQLYRLRGTRRELLQ